MSGFVEGDRIFSGDSDCDRLRRFCRQCRSQDGRGSGADDGPAGRISPQETHFSWPDRRIYVQTAFFYLNPDQYNGASLLGLRGIVVKSHGRAERRALCNAILLAAQEAKHQLPLQIADRLEAVFSDRDL